MLLRVPRPVHTPLFHFGINDDLDRFSPEQTRPFTLADDDEPAITPPVRLTVLLVYRAGPVPGNAGEN